MWEHTFKSNPNISTSLREEKFFIKHGTGRLARNRHKEIQLNEKLRMNYAAYLLNANKQRFILPQLLWVMLGHGVPKTVWRPRSRVALAHVGAREVFACERTQSAQCSTHAETTSTTMRAQQLLRGAEEHRWVKINYAAAGGQWHVYTYLKRSNQTTRKKKTATSFCCVSWNITHVRLHWIPRNLPTSGKL